MKWRSVRPTPEERTRSLPGDRLIPHAIAALTHAVTIRRRPRAVWPWLVQMGAGSRAGWYSYDLVDNGGHRSADRILPSQQDIAIGTLFPARPRETGGFHVLALEPFHYLVLGWVPPSSTVPMVTWAFVLESIDDATTRLITRARGSADYPFYGLPAFIGLPFVRVVHFLMERKQLLGIAWRAECAPAPSH